MNNKQSLLKFYEKCVEKGYTDMSSEDQRLDAKVVAADFGLKYKDIGDLFNEAKEAKVEADRLKEEAKAEEERLKIDGELLATIYSTKMAVGVFMRSDNSVYSVLNKDQRINKAPRIDVKQGGRLNYTYHPSKAIYTGATVGGITTGGVEYTKAGYSEKVGDTGTGYIDITIGGETFTANSITFSPLIKKRFKRDASFNLLVDKSGYVACKKYQPHMNGRVGMALSSRNYMETMSLLSEIADSERLPYSKCVEIANLLGRVVNVIFPPLDEDVYNQALSLLASGTSIQIGQAEKLLLDISDYKDATDLVYRRAVELSGSETSAEVTHSIELFNAIPDYKNSKSLAQKASEKLDDILHEEKKKTIIEKENQKKRTKKVAAICVVAVVAVVAVVILVTSVVIPSQDYKEAANLMESGEVTSAAIAYGKAGTYKDAEDLSRSLWNQVAVRETISVGNVHTVGLKSDGTVVATGQNDHGECKVNDWTDIVAVSVGCSGYLSYGHTIGLKSDGTVVATGANYVGQCDVDSWTNIVTVCADDSYTVGLRSDGTVVATGGNLDGECDVNRWTDIVTVSTCEDHTVGLRSDGTVVATGQNDDGQCNVNAWTNIVAVSTGYRHTVGLKADGTVVATGQNDDGQCNVDAWTDIVAVSTGDSHTVGLKSDGTVVATGQNDDGQCSVNTWTDIVAIYAANDRTVGLKSDGTVVAVGDNDNGACDVDDWTNIVDVFVSGAYTVGLKSDGTVVATGTHLTYGRCHVDGWTNIKIPERAR